MNREEVKEQAERVLRELAEHLGEIELEETYNVIQVEGLREDTAPEVDPEFVEAALSIAPRRDERYYVAEAGAWV